jgi:ELWxxDGT repeat protein
MPRREPRRRKLRVERLEDRAMLAGDLELVRDVNATPVTVSSFPNDFVDVGATLYFTANDGVNGFELWRSDGTAAGTLLVKDIFPGSLNAYRRYLTDVGGALFFNANNGVNGWELWKSDGTAYAPAAVRKSWAIATSGVAYAPAAVRKSWAIASGRATAR